MLSDRCINELLRDNYLRPNEKNERLKNLSNYSILDLLIGVDDDQNILGLDDDISTLKKQDIDGFELQLVEVIKKYIGKELSTHIKIKFPEIDNKKICQITVSKSAKSVFVNFERKEDFFIRSGCSSQLLGRGEQSAYEKEHWG